MFRKDKARGMECAKFLTAFVVSTLLLVTLPLASSQSELIDIGQNSSAYGPRIINLDIPIVTTTTTGNGSGGSNSTYNATYAMWAYNQTEAGDSRFVNIDGDTMTGELIVPTLNVSVANITTFDLETMTWRVYDDGTNAIMEFPDVGGVNYLSLETTGTFFQMYGNPGPANNYLMATITETQGSDTEINFYEGGVGHNRFWDSGSARFGGDANYLCSNLTTDVDCDTGATGADVVVQDDIWAGGKVISENATFYDRVGIGTTTPGNALEVVGPLSLAGFLVNFTAGSTDPILTIENVQSSTYADGLKINVHASATAADSEGLLIVNEGGTPRFVVDADGKTGISNSAPVPKLEIGDVSSLALAQGIMNTGTRNMMAVGGNTFGAIMAEGSSQASLFLLDSGGGTNNKYFQQVKVNDLTVFRTLTDAGSINNIFMNFKDSNGFIGMGTDNPQHELNVVGDLNVTGTVYYGALQAQSPHFFNEDGDVGYTRFCMKDAQGYYNLMWFDAGIMQVETNSRTCIDKRSKIIAEKLERTNNRLARETNETSLLI